MKTINELLEIRNSLVDEEERAEMYDVMDACDTEEQAVEMLEREIEQLQK